MIKRGEKSVSLMSKTGYFPQRETTDLQDPDLYWVLGAPQFCENCKFFKGCPISMEGGYCDSYEVKTVKYRYE